MKTTLYIPDDLKTHIGKLASRRGVSEAELIREALRNFIADAAPPRPRLPLFKSGKPRLAENADKALRGFGET
jgi:Ribbon-helix-helix protein, copG family